MKKKDNFLKNTRLLKMSKEDTKISFTWRKEYRVKIRDCINLVLKNKPKNHPEKNIILKFISEVPLSYKILSNINSIILKSWKENRAFKIGKIFYDICSPEKHRKVLLLLRKLKSIPNDFKNIEYKIEILGEIFDIILENVNQNITLDPEEEPFSEKELIQYSIEDDGDSYVTKEKYRLYLVEAIFRYYKYVRKNNLLDSGFNINDIIKNKKLTEDQKFSLITSYEQNQKSFLMIAVIIIYLSAGYTPIVLSKDNNQKNQLLSRINKELENIVDYLQKNHKFSERALQIFENVLYYDSKNPYKEDDNSLKDALKSNTNKRRIIKCIKECTHIKRIHDNISNDSKICLFLDEAHLTGGYKLIKNINNNEEYHFSNEENKDFVIYDSYIADLKNKSDKIVLITATAQDIFMTEKNLYSDNVVFIPASDNYRGLVNSLKFRHIDVKEENYINDILNTLSKKQPIPRYDYKNKKADLHPICNVVKSLSTIEEQKNLFNHRIQVDKRSTYILFTGSTGFSMYHNTLGDKSITINGYNSIVDDDNVHHFKNSYNIIISDVLQFLSERGVELHPIIHIINYHMCCEGISYSSHWDKPQNWHATSMILNLSSNITASNARQVASRVFGAHGDDIINECWCVPKLQEKIVKAYELHDKQIKSVCALSGKGNVKVRDYLSELSLFKNIIPTKYHAVRDITEYNNIAINKNQTKENKIFRNEGRVIENFSKLYPKKYEKELENIIKYENKCKKNKKEFVDEIIRQRKGLRKNKIEKGDDVKTIDGVDVNKLKDWFREDNNILVARMIKFLYNKDKEISIEEFEDGIKYSGKDIISNISNGRGIGTKYGMLWKVSNNKTILNPKIKSYLNKL